MGKIRIERLNKELQRILNIAVTSKARDPRLTWVSITEVRVSKDMQHARVYYSYLEDSSVTPEVMQGVMTRLTGFMKRQIAAAHIMRVIPEITIVYDEVEQRAGRLDNIFQKLQNENDRDTDED
ncbi:MAG: 30S ribosome-binding factor RbfA [Candidatus Cloacimonetes bacterium]|nr:30S ribosome-binding factor RbfA [Candidatus Cloacimonadota bacterium]